MTILEDLKSGRLVVVPREATDSLLRSMAVRSDHGLGCPGYYDQEMFAASGVTHARRLESAMTTMRQLHEEVVGTGFHSATPDHTAGLIALVEGMEREMGVANDAREAHAACAAALIASAEGEIEAIEKALGADAVRFMLSPDGGDPTLAEMVANMRQQLDAAEARALAAEAKADALREALAKAQAWHESEDKALSKSGRNDADYHWRRLQHREQLDAIKGALPEAEYSAAWGRMNARYEQETADE